MMDSDMMLRRVILLQLDAASPISLPTETLLNGLRAAGFNLEEKSLYVHLDYLAQKHFLHITRSPISASHIRAKLSAKGRDYLEAGDI